MKSRAELDELKKGWPLSFTIDDDEKDNQILCLKCQYCCGIPLNPVFCDLGSCLYCENQAKQTIDRGNCFCGKLQKYRKPAENELWYKFYKSTLVKCRNLNCQKRRPIAKVFDHEDRCVSVESSVVEQNFKSKLKWRTQWKGKRDSKELIFSKDSCSVIYKPKQYKEKFYVQGQQPIEENEQKEEEQCSLECYPFTVLAEKSFMLKKKPEWKIIISDQCTEFDVGVMFNDQYYNAESDLANQKQNSLSFSKKLLCKELEKEHLGFYNLRLKIIPQEQKLMCYFLDQQFFLTSPKLKGKHIFAAVTFYGEAICVIKGETQ